MSVKRSEKVDKMSVEYVTEAKGMADFILTKVHRGPGDTVEAAIHRAERLYGVPANWLHRLRYREIKDMPVSASRRSSWPIERPARQVRKPMWGKENWQMRAIRNWFAWLILWLARKMKGL